jgi:phosphoribosylglycinamide formyltransferase 1
LEKSKRRIAVFASGSGSNAQKIFEYFKDSDIAEVACVLTNKSDAYVIERARLFNIPVLVFSRKDCYESNKIIQYLKDQKVDLIVLAGFLWLVPENIIQEFPNRIINIHPALLPKYGGKGMYGNFVHQAVIENKEKESGITIHFANLHFDEGEIILQRTCEVDESDTIETLAKKVQKLEHEFYPKAIENIIKNI